MDWKLVEAIFIIIFVKVPGWFLKHPRMIIVIVALVAGLFIWRSCACQSKPQPTTSPTQTKQEQLAPKITLAPYILQTPSRYYYVATYTKDSEKQVTLTKWWEWEKDKWTPRTLPLPVNDTYGAWRLSDRKTGNIISQWGIR